MKTLHMVAFSLAMVGAINWGLVGLMNLNLVSTLVGAGSPLEKIVYILVGLSAVLVLATHKGDCKMCAGK